MTPEVTASYFLKHELPVFECSSNRRPKAAGWNKLDYWEIDGEEADIWKCYGIALEANWLVIDVDLRKPEAHDSFKRLSEFVDFTSCFTCKTARGGFHYWFKNPTLQPIRKNLNEYKGIDFLSVGCYVIGPGSHAETGTYTYSLGSLESCPEAGDAMLSLLSRIQKRHEAGPTSVQSTIEVSRFKQWLDAQPNAIEGENGNDYTFQMAACGVDFGLNPYEIMEVMAEWNTNNIPPWADDELRVIINNAYKYAQNAKGKAAIQFEAFTADDASEFLTPPVPTLTETDEQIFEKLHPGCGMTYRGESILATATNIRLILLSERYKGLFSWDMMKKKIILDRIPEWRGNKTNISTIMDDMDWRELRIDLSIQSKLDVPNYLLEDGVYAMASARPFHPIRDWLNKLVWDGTPRFGMMFGHGHYERTLAEIFTLAAVYRIFQPGYEFHHMLVLSGSQGIGKSMFVRVMGGEYTTALRSMPTDRKGQQELEGAWWIEFPEMSAVKKVDINAVKAFITLKEDTYIPMYGRSGVQTFPRIFIPVWTLNPTELGFITDKENRRFLIIELKRDINIKYIEKHRDQIYAEAMHMYKSGITPHGLVKTIKNEAEAVAQVNRQEDSDPWEDLIDKWLKLGDKTQAKNSDVYEGALGMVRPETWDKRTQMRIATCLKRLGWCKCRNVMGNYFVKMNEQTLDKTNDEWDIEV